MTETNARFTVYTEETESGLQIDALTAAVGEFLESDVPVAVELTFVDGEEIRELNRGQRSVDAVTDVLSFPSLDGILGKALKGADYPYDMDENGNLMIGSIVICRERAREQAAEYGHSYEREINYLLTHGILHCLGYDHMTDEDKALMRRKEEEILQKAGLQRD